MRTPIVAATMALMRSPRWDKGPAEDSGNMRLSGSGGRTHQLVGWHLRWRPLPGRSASVLTVRKAEDDRNEDQRGHSCKQQAADHGTTQWRVLFATLAQAQRH